MIKVVQLEPTQQWDQYQFEQLFNKRNWNPVRGYDFEVEAFASGSEFGVLSGLYDGIVLLVPAKFYFDKTDYINEQSKSFKFVLYIITGNEEGEFDLSKLDHPNKKIYFTTPHMQRTELDLIDRWFGDGASPPIAWLDNPDFTKGYKTIEAFFSGQVTHERREMAYNQLEALKSKYIIHASRSDGFTRSPEGLTTEDYYKNVAASKVVVSPSGPETCDTFRVYEALESLAVPIVDTRTPKDGQPSKYWDMLFDGDAPFYFIRDDYGSLPSYIGDALAHYPANANRSSAWWIQKRREYAYNLTSDLAELRGGSKTASKSVFDEISVIIPVSPIPSHPDTAILDETIATIKTHLPDCEIIITFDGVRAEQEDWRANYEEHIHRTIWKCLHDEDYRNVLPIIFDEHSHQVKMMRETLKHIKTPLLLYVEGDAPLTPDCAIDFKGISRLILNGHADLVRLYHEAVVPEPHKYLMLDEESIEIDGVPVVRTVQWSQRPNIASVAYYRRILNSHFSSNAITFIEDKMYGVVTAAWSADGELGWQSHRLMIYAPEAGNWKRSYTTDGRANSPKWEDKLVF